MGNDVNSIEKKTSSLQDIVNSQKEFHLKFEKLKARGNSWISLAGAVIEEYKYWILSEEVNNNGNLEQLVQAFVEHYTKNRIISSLWHAGTFQERCLNLLAWTIFNYFQVESSVSQLKPYWLIFDSIRNEAKKTSAFSQLVNAINFFSNLLASSNNQEISEIDYSNHDKIEPKIQLMNQELLNSVIKRLMNLIHQQINCTNAPTSIKVKNQQQRNKLPLLEELIKKFLIANEMMLKNFDELLPKDSKSTAQYISHVKRLSASS